MNKIDQDNIIWEMHDIKNSESWHFFVWKMLQDSKDMHSPEIGYHEGNTLLTLLTKLSEHARKFEKKNIHV